MHHTALVATHGQKKKLFQFLFLLTQDLAFFALKKSRPKNQNRNILVSFVCFGFSQCFQKK